MLDLPPRYARAGLMHPFESSLRVRGWRCASVAAPVFGALLGCSAEDAKTEDGPRSGRTCAARFETSPVVNIETGRKDSQPSVRCAATKIGARVLLTARHCVEADPQRSLLGLGPGLSTPFLRLAVEGEVSQPVVEKIVRFNPDGGSCEIATCDGTIGSIPDVALIILAAETPTVPEAIVDTGALRFDDDVVVVGFGCDAPPCPFPNPKRVVHERVAWRATGGITERLDAFVTSGGQLRHGDSGGPAFRCDVGAAVVGVTSFEVGKYALHERVVDRPEFALSGWIRSHGGNVR